MTERRSPDPSSADRPDDFPLRAGEGSEVAEDATEEADGSGAHATEEADGSGAHATEEADESGAHVTEEADESGAHVTEEADELGAHVSAAGGVDRAPARAREIASVCYQLFTKQPSRWAEPELEAETVRAFREESEAHRIRVAGAHDSYLINLASPKADLWEKSAACFEGELRRCAELELDFVVTHPGNATDGDMESGLARNAEGVTRALERVPAPTRVLLEITAGSGTTVGATFENLATIVEGVASEHRHRVGVCFDTCHAYAAGYDLVDDWEGVWDRFDDVIGLDRLGLFHLNDSKHPFGSRKDRHEHLGRGSLGTAPFRRLVLDERFEAVPKVLETPKEDDPVENDLRNLGLLRRLRREG